jgi:hypothetical protein
MQKLESTRPRRMRIAIKPRRLLTRRCIKPTVV